MNSLIKALLSGLLFCALPVASSLGCSESPVYVQPPEALEAGTDAEDPENPGVNTQVVLPIRLETEEEATKRAELSAELGIDVPYIKIDDWELSLEWTIRNLDDSDATARIGVNGANELFEYVPAGFVIDPEEEAEPPPLMGNIPIVIPALGSVSGVFREDEIREASVDLELITQGGLNPFAAVLGDNEDTAEIIATGGTIPASAFASIVRFDLSLLSNRHVVMEYAVRVRSSRSPGLIHTEGLSAITGELTVFAPATFVPPPPPPEE